MTFNELHEEYMKMCNNQEECRMCKYYKLDAPCELAFGYDKGREDAIDEIKQSFHNVYSASLYCLEDMADDCKEHGCNCDDCLYVMFNKVLEQLKEKNNGSK